MVILDDFYSKVKLPPCLQTESIESVRTQLENTKEDQSFGENISEMISEKISDISPEIFFSGVLEFGIYPIIFYGFREEDPTIWVTLTALGLLETLRFFSQNRLRF